MMWLAAFVVVAQTRIASDFEIAQMKEQIARSRDFVSQLSGHLNLGDLYASRTEMSTARSEYTLAREIAQRQSLSARKESDITRYATAVMYGALASAKLGDSSAAFESAEEAIRYTSDSAKSWNLYSTAMSILRKPQKAVSAARNAVAIATREVAKTPSIANRLDLAVYQYSLASALIDNGASAEAERLLQAILSDLKSSAFASLRREVARSESFEIYSSARGDPAAYLSLVNRAGLRLGALLEQRGDLAGARREYENVLAARSDDPTALAALARLATPAERERYFTAAFDANPFSMPLIRAYQRHLRTGARPAASTNEGAGSRVREALVAISRGETRKARELLDALLQSYPNNQSLETLRRETEVTPVVPAFLASSAASMVTPTSSELRQLIALLQSDKLTPEQRSTLDRIAFVSDLAFDAATPSNGQTILSSGTIDDVRFRFSEPTTFTGTFGTRARLTYRILGVTASDGADALLLEPVKIEALR